MLMKQQLLLQRRPQTGLRLRRLLLQLPLQRHLLLQLPLQLPPRQPGLPQMRQSQLPLPKFPIQKFRLQPMRRLQQPLLLLHQKTLRLRRLLLQKPLLLLHQKTLRLRRLLLPPMMQYQELSPPTMQRKQQPMLRLLRLLKRLQLRRLLRRLLRKSMTRGSLEHWLKIPLQQQMLLLLPHLQLPQPLQLQRKMHLLMQLKRLWLN